MTAPARGAVALAAVLAGCAADDIVMYRARALHESKPAEGGAAFDAGEPPAVESGGHTSPSGGTTSNPRPAGMGGAGIPVRPPPPPSGGTGGGSAAGGSGAASGAPPTGGASSGGASPSGGFPGLPVTCTAATDCPSGWTCAKLDCANPTGVCQVRPLLCDGTVLPVCGCDGVTYWNDCIRQQNGVAASMLGQCTRTALPCSQGSDCKVPGASCARLDPTPSGGCGTPGPGTCWVTPSDCATTPTAQAWTSCQQPGTGQPPQHTCTNTCEAIRSEQLHVLATPGVGCH